MPKVSVVIPTYNHAHFLGDAINSVLNQTHTRCEAIIIDDGSTDDPRSVVLRYQDPRIHFIAQENRGLAGARNKGIDCAKGEFLAFLDADDQWEPEFVEQCLRVLAADPTLVGVYTGHHFVDEDGNLISTEPGRNIAPEQLYQKLLEGGFFPPCTMLIRSDIVREVGKFDTRLRGMGAEDWDLWLRIAEHYRIQSLSLPLARYRVSRGSMSSNAERMHENRLAVLKKHYGPLGTGTEHPPYLKSLAYGFAYRKSTIEFMQQEQPERAWDYFTQAVNVWPPLLERIDTFYELICGEQAYGCRGQLRDSAVEGNGKAILGHLHALFAESPPLHQRYRSTALGQAYLALAMLNDQAGQWGKARKYLTRAITNQPRLLSNGRVIRRLLKLCAGKRMVGWLSRMRSDRHGTQPGK